MGDERGAAESGKRTVLGYPRADLWVILVGLPLLGALLALAAPPVARWVLHGPKIPMRIVFRFIGRADEPWEVACGLAGGLVVGLLIAFTAMSETTKVTLTDTLVEIEQDDRTKRIERTDVAAVFLDGKRLVVLDDASRPLVVGVHQAPGPILARAFRAHGYPWHDADPYGALFREWVPGSTEPPPELRTLLAARKSALKRKSDGEVRDLTATIESLDFVVRDAHNIQYWRPLASA